MGIEGGMEGEWEAFMAVVQFPKKKLISLSVVSLSAFFNSRSPKNEKFTSSWLSHCAMDVKKIV